MALSKNVKENLDDAAGSLRAALANAARSERPSVVQQLGQILYALDMVSKAEEYTDHMENFVNKFTRGPGDIK